MVRQPWPRVVRVNGGSFFSFDDHAWYRPDVGLKTPTELAGVVDQVLAEPTWVSEGIYHDWTDPLIDPTGLVVWLDPTWPIALWRILIRHIKADLQRNNRFLGYGRLLRFLAKARSYYVDGPEGVDTATDWTRNTTEPYAEQLGERMVRRAKISASEVLWLIDD